MTTERVAQPPDVTIVTCSETRAVDCMQSQCIFLPVDLCCRSLGCAKPSTPRSSSERFEILITGDFRPPWDAICHFHGFLHILSCRCGSPNFFGLEQRTLTYPGSHRRGGERRRKLLSSLSAAQYRGVCSPPHATLVAFRSESEFRCNSSRPRRETSLALCHAGRVPRDLVGLCGYYYLVKLAGCADTGISGEETRERWQRPENRVKNTYRMR